jgi:ferritin-like metal-binding protein YciE
MKLESLNDLFLHQIKDLYNAEQQLTKALPKMAENATSKKLKTAFESHLKETENHVKRLEQVFQVIGEQAKGEKCKAMEGLIKESEDFIKEKPSKEVMDAGLIANAQRVEHYEIAGYGTACTYAKTLGFDEAVNLLQQTLDEEKKTDQKLTDIAVGSINEKAE